MLLSDLIKDLVIIEKRVCPDTEISDICYDSRKAAPGTVFVAVRGFESDGHRYIDKAVSAGSTVVICEEIPQECSYGYILVPDSRLALAQVSAAFFGYPAREMKLIGVTGTNGKTTTTHLIKHMLEEKCGAKVGLVGTNGNMIGSEHISSDRTTPESYELQKLFGRMRDEGCTHVVMEVSSHALVLHRVAGIRFSCAVYTNLTQDHLDFHGTMENYAEAKKQLFSMCDTACINTDDPWAQFMLDGLQCRTITYSASDHGADITAEDISLDASGVSFTASYGGERKPVSLCIPGMFSVHNALSTVSAGIAAGMSLEDAADALASAEGVRGRVERVKTDGDYSVIIDYSHTPDSLDNILKTLRPVTRGRLICVFGCGGDRDKKKRPIMGRIASSNSDICIVTNDNPRTEDPDEIIREILPGVESGSAEIEVIPDRISAIHWAIDNALEGDVILLAGKGQEDYQEIGHVKYHLDEREIVADYLRLRAEKN